MIVYLLKSAFCLALFQVFYLNILEREKMHKFKRFYLLGSVVLSFLIPLSTIIIPSESKVAEHTESFDQFIYIEQTSFGSVESVFNYPQLFSVFYFSIAFVLLVRFAKNLARIILKIDKNQKVEYQNATLVLIDDEILPHTFWSYIFINREQYQKGEIKEELFTHELAHVVERHTVDIFLMEILQIVFWINPLFVFLKKSIKLNHEFIADEMVINRHKNTLQYQYLLLSKTGWKNEHYLASNLNHSLTKKRLYMMTKQSSLTTIWLKKLAIIPLLPGFVFLFAERVEAQEIAQANQEPYEISLSSVEDSDETRIVKQSSNEAKSLSSPHFHNDWYITIDGEKYYYTFDKNERIARYYKNNILVDLDIVNEYKKKNNTYKKLINTGKHYIYKPIDEQKEIKREFSDLGGMYFRMSRIDKRSVERPLNFYNPYVRLEKDNKVFYKLRTELTQEDKLLLPQPPPPNEASSEG